MSVAHPQPQRKRDRDSRFSALICWLMTMSGSRVLLLVAISVAVCSILSILSYILHELPRADRTGFVGTLIQQADGSIAIQRGQPTGIVSRICDVYYNGEIRTIGPLHYAIVERHVHDIGTNNYSSRSNPPGDAQLRPLIAAEFDQGNYAGPLFDRQPSSGGYGPAGSAIYRGRQYTRVVWRGVFGLVALFGAIVAALLALLLAASTGMRRQWARRSGRCQTCGYSLAGLRSTKCPECGAVSDR